MRQALGTAVFLGMIGGTLFGLLLTPVFRVAIRTLVPRFRQRDREERCDRDLHGTPGRRSEA